MERATGTHGTDGRWPLRRLAAWLAPAVYGTVWINLYMAALIGTWVGWPAPSPTLTLGLALVVLPLPLWLAARWLRRLLDRAAD